MNEARQREELSDLAHDVVYSVMEEAELSGRHTLGSWVKEGLSHHMHHSSDHMQEVFEREWDNPLDIPEEEFTHAICRLVMAYWSWKQGILGDNGDEGNG